MSDSLLAAAGLLSPTVAGEALALDYMDLEQQRQMTIKAANISLYHEINGIPYLINLHDTPGHIDFTGNVTRSLRAIDGAVVVVDAVEGVMIQTETVTRQALDERVRPMLFINKIDRLVKELRLTSDQILKTLTDIIRDFNHLIELYCEAEYRENWRVDPLAGTVVFGCAKDRWAFTYDTMNKKGLKFSDIVSAYTKGEEKGLSETIPLHEAVLGMVVANVPPPQVSQKYRIPKIWKGDLDSDIGKALLGCDEKGPAVMATTHIRVDPSAGIVATGRLFSGTMTEGDEVFMINSRRNGRIQQVGLYMGPFREVVGSLPAGNIPALLGLGEVKSGETIASVKDLNPFETVHYVSETVMTLAIEPKHPKDLPKLSDVMRRLSIEDPNIKTKIEEKTGEFLISGMGQLHLEIATTLIRKDGVDIVTSEPIVVYRESARGSSGEITARSPNGHNKVSVIVEPLEGSVMNSLANGELTEMMEKKTQASLLRKAGWSADDARGVWSISDSLSIFVDATKGIQRLDEVGGSLRIGFVDAVTQGVLAREPVRGLKVKLTDASIHEDPAHHGPAQMIPAVRRAIYAATLLSSPVLLEPILRLDVRTSADLVGTITRIVSQIRGKVLNVEQKEHLTYIVGEIPAAETFNLAEVIRSSTGGRAFWDTSFSRWEAVPASITPKVITDIRRRKGLPPDVPKVEDFLE